MAEVTYGKTPIGQLIYDLAFVKLTDRWIARKHKLPLSDVPKLRAAAKRGLRSGKRLQRKRRR